MKKRLALPIALIALVGLMASFASTAMANPDQSAACSNCHSGNNVPITASLVSDVGGSSTYDVITMGADEIAVFDGDTKLFAISGVSGQFTVADGKTYTLYAVAGPSESDGIGTTTVSPTAAPSDTTPPVTVSNAKATYVASATITLAAADSGSGVAATHYVLDGGPQADGSSVTVTTPGAHTLEFWSVDVAGNIEPHSVVNFEITTVVTPPTDTTAPTTVSDAKATYDSSATIKLTATDNTGGSGIAHTYYVLDGGTQAEGTSVSTSVAGNHTLEFWSADVAGNIESPRNSATFEVTTVVTPPTDTTAPTTVSDANGPYVGTATIHLTATDNVGGSGVARTYYLLDDDDMVEGTTVTTSTVGVHYLTFWSEDAAGNIENPHNNTVVFEIAPVVTPPTDTTAPVTTSDAKATYDSSATIKLTATDNTDGSGVAHTYYVLDGGTQAEGTSVSTSVAGSHTLEFWSADVAGNVESPRNSATFEVTTVVTPPTDTTAPTTVSDAKATYDSNATIKLTATDNNGGSGVAHTYYVLDGGAQADGTSVSTSVAGTHTLEFWSADVAGNIESPRNSATFEVTTVVTPPVVSTHTVRLHINLHHANASKLTATLTNKNTGAKFVGKIDRKGNLVFTNVPTGTYRLNVTGKHFSFRAQTIYVGVHHWNHRK